jgi:3-hydroxyacyl-CoA dehydrogenase/enoyl-CoA hydratase/3-hydroxybutyryl-CoA epimerase
VIASPRDGDVGAVLGMGFPPFLGGPFHYGDSVGTKELVEGLENLAERLGADYAPASILRDLARKGGRFFQ